MISRAKGLAAAMLAAGALIGCADAPTAPAERPEASRDAKEGAPATLRWNGYARALVTSRLTDPPMASRVYAMLGVAQHAAVLASQGVRADGPGAPRRASLRAAVAAASVEILAHAYPADAPALAAALADDHAALRAIGQRDGDIAAGDALGREVASRVIAYAASDGAGASWSGTVPTGTDVWYSSASPPRPPLRPMWPHVRPWLMESGDQFRPPPPPAVGSPEFLEALAEVRRVSDTRTAEQLRIAHLWGDGPATPTPPGHWNAIAATLIHEAGLSERRATQILALLNMAMMDAGIACWDAKYTYWLPRPSQIDPAITLPVGLPNFPAYVSGHASFSGAASEVLAAAFRDEADAVRSMADEAAMSRLYGGIHYRFDSERGLELGRRIGRLATPRLYEEALAPMLAPFLP